MRGRIVLAAAVVAAILIGAAFLTVRRSAGTETAAGLPAAGDFAPGVCGDAADTILALARVTRQTDPAAVSERDRADLRTWQQRIWAMRTGADGEVLDSVTEVVLSLGYLRVRLDSRTAEPEYLRQAEEARSRLQSACIAP